MKKCNRIYVKSLQFFFCLRRRKEVVFVSTERSSRALDTDDESDDLSGEEALLQADFI